jgi:hypothetical protein
MADVHDTPDRLPPPPGEGVDSILQLEPSQRSANGRPLLSPTAVHDLADTHDTPDRLLLGAPFGLGVVWIVQLTPSQRSANVTRSP